MGDSTEVLPAAIRAFQRYETAIFLGLAVILGGICS
jgi:hypothetical protein